MQWIILIAVLILSVTSAAVDASETDESELALRRFFDPERIGKRVTVWNFKGVRHIEIDTDYGLLITRPGLANSQGDSVLWDALLLLKQYVDVDNVNTDRFVVRYGSYAKEVLERYSHFDCSGAANERSHAACIVRNLAAVHSLSFYLVTTDEGFRCTSLLSTSDFKTPIGKPKCIDMVKRGR